ncbi:hypothetical protein QYE76_017620 [Lolium multiflorum]|uniref:rRNA N-glycosylase n=1 Tax=Lolium multiflorum TaxID=4521 RepID=A0AAD8QCB1_LOLMU|nr:hypothetical protein QYE76_017620 [Lolium multiflorum]
MYLHTGWDKFAHAHNLKVGCLLTFLYGDGVALPQPLVVMLLSYNVGSGTYSKFVDNVRTALATHPSPDSTQGHLVLMKQPFRLGHPPGRLLQVELSVGNTSATLAIRDDNLYVVGFRPPSGSWYELCKASKGPHQQQIIPGSTLLDCGAVTYRDLVGGTTREEVNRGRSRI